jgi:hypothetical protein
LSFFPLPFLHLICISLLFHATINICPVGA